MLRKEKDNQIIEFQTDEQNTPAANSISRATLRQLKYMTWELILIKRMEIYPLVMSQSHKLSKKSDSYKKSVLIFSSKVVKQAKA